MDYMTVAAVSQIAAMLLFLTLAVVVVVYVLWPGTAAKLEAAQRRALDLGSDDLSMRRGK
jgi:hypothetical protein